MDIELTRYYPASQQETFPALIQVVRQLARFQRADEFSGTISFATRMTGWASGANIQAVVMPSPQGGVQVHMQGQAKMRTQINANNAAHKQLVAILDATSALIQYNRQQPAHQPSQQAQQHNQL